MPFINSHMPDKCQFCDNAATAYINPSVKLDEPIPVCSLHINDAYDYIANGLKEVQDIIDNSAMKY